MQATTDLRSEHVAVLRMLDVLHAIAARASAGDAVDAADVRDGVEFLHVFVDRCHHTKEEQLLFPAMREAGLDDAQQRMIARLVDDHVWARAAAERMAAGGLTSAVIEYEAIVRPHIMLEENGAFDVADRELRPEVQKRLAEGYERIEHEVIGEGRHEAFHALLHRLSEKYLQP